MNEYAELCNDANRIAAQLRGQGFKTRAQVKKQVRLNKPREVRAYATGIAGKGGYLREAKKARVVEVLAFCHEFFEQNDQLPPQACVAERFKVFEQTAQTYMRALAEAGHLERNAVGKWRFARRRP